jgi:hypothetical protein
MATVPQQGVASQQATLVSLLRAMFPHASFPDGPYERSAAAILQSTESDVRAQGRLIQGLTDLEARSGGPFTGLAPDAALEVLRGMSASPFFEAVRAKAILTLYNDPEVWRLLGWEGSSYEHGGYLERGYGDLDWLPEPSLGEVQS